jgi:hypothetical protein
MFKHRFLAIGVLALLAVSMAVSNHYSRRSSTTTTEASDFYQRHPDWTSTVNQQNSVIPVTGEQAFPDYLQRHPVLIAPAAAPVDTSDYYFRHPELSVTSGSQVDLTDYYFRHIHNRSLP